MRRRRNQKSKIQNAIREFIAKIYSPKPKLVKRSWREKNSAAPIKLFIASSAFFIVSLVIFGIFSLYGKTIVQRFFYQNNAIVPYTNFYSLDEVRQKLNNQHMSFEYVKVGDVDSLIEVKLKDGPLVLFSQTKDLVWQITSLRDLMAKLSIEHIASSSASQKPLVIDFSFDKPIVKF